MEIVIKKGKNPCGKFSLIIILLLFNCSTSKTVEKHTNKNEVFIHSLNMSLVEFEKILQDALSLNQLDFLYSDKEKSDGLTIVVNEFIKPYHKYMNLVKFDKKVKFATHNKIFSEENEKFMDIAEGSIIENNDTLNMIIGLRYKFTAINAKFVKENGKWKMINKNSKPPFSYLPNYNFKKDKEQCLAEQIIALKSRKPTTEKCKKYRFDF